MRRDEIRFVDHHNKDYWEAVAKAKGFRNAGDMAREAVYLFLKSRPLSAQETAMVDKLLANAPYPPSAALHDPSGAK